MKTTHLYVLVLALGLLVRLGPTVSAQEPRQPDDKALAALASVRVNHSPVFNPISTILDEAEASQPSFYEGYYLYLYDDGGDYPSLANPGWHEEAQGITHDDSNWFITQKSALWKIAVNLDLATPGSPNVTPGLYRINLQDVPELSSQGYDHFGDLSYYETSGQEFLLIALEVYTDPPDQKPAVAVFRAGTLDFLDYERLWKQDKNNGPWVAVDPQTGVIYTSRGDNVSSINRWSVNWDKLLAAGELDPPQELADLQIFNKQGGILTLDSVQGGVISPNGELLYLVGKDENDSSAQGIQVLELSTGRRVMHSTNGYGHFNYHFDPGGWPDDMEEPEGITIWDLDNIAAPGISGQLHVMMLDNDFPSEDEVTVEHYTRSILVDGSYSGPGVPDKNGTPSYPFKTVTDAYGLAWDRAQIKIKPGAYTESLTLSKRVELIAVGRTVTIGK